MFSYYEIENGFRAAMADAGIITNEIIIADGHLHRAYVEGDRRGTKNLSYVLHMDGRPSGYFEYFRTGTRSTWSLSGEREPLTPAMRQQIEAERIRRQAEQAERHAKAAKTAAYIWRKCKPISHQSEHPYLVAKRIQPHTLRLSRGALVVPIYSEARELVSLQFIGPNLDAPDNKRLLRGGLKKSCFSPIGDFSNVTKILIAEGYATGASLNEALNLPVLMGVDAGNLEPVALAARRLFPGAEIIVCADNDIKKTGENTGLEAAARAAQAVGGRVAVPELDGQKCDFWDVLNERGADAVRDQLGAGATSTLFDDGDTLGANAKPAQFLINRILEADAHGILGAQSQAFKSFLAIKLAHSICTGRDFFGHEVFTTGPVLYVCGEGKGAVQRRIKATQIQLGDFNGNLKIWSSDIAIDSLQSMRGLKNAIEKLKPVLVIFDTFSSLIRGDVNENDNAQVARVIRLVKDTCAGASSLVIHHFGKTESSGFRGASAFFSNIDFGFVMKRDGDSMLTELSCTKMKDGEPFAPITMTARVVELGFDNQDGSAATSLVLERGTFSGTRGTLGDKRAKLTAIESAVLTSLVEVIAQIGIHPPSEIQGKYAGFTGTGERQRKVTTISEWRKRAYLVIPNDSETNEQRLDTLKKAFKRAREALFNKGHIVLHGEFAWVIYD